MVCVMALRTTKTHVTLVEMETMKCSGFLCRYGEQNNCQSTPSLVVAHCPIIVEGAGTSHLSAFLSEGKMESDEYQAL